MASTERAPAPDRFQPPAAELVWRPLRPRPQAPDSHARTTVQRALACSAVPVEEAAAHADEPRASRHYRWRARGRAYHLTLQREEVLLTIDDHPLVGVFPTHDPGALAALQRHLPPRPRPVSSLNPWSPPQSDAPPAD